MNDEQLTQRMRAASEAIEIPDRAQARHLEAIAAALSGPDVIALSPARSSRRRQVIASIVAAAVIAPAGLAAASDGAIPGDTLYGIKQLTERVQVLFDSDVIARHRIEEIEALRRAGRVEPDLYDEARAALMELDENHPLWQRLSAATEARADEDDHRADERPVPPAAVTVDLDLPGGSQAAVTIENGRITAITAPTGWTVVEMDDDEATLTSPSYRVDIDFEDDGTLRTEIVTRTDDDDASSEEGGSEAPEPDDDATGSTTPEISEQDESDDSDSGAAEEDDTDDDGVEDGDEEDDESEGG